MAKFVDNFYHENAPAPGPGAVGGLWELHGNLQKKYLIEQGLTPKHKLLDIGCGVFRLGVKIIPYLEQYNYYGSDAHQSYIDAGFDYIDKLGKLDKLRKENFCCNWDFDFSSFEDELFDYAFAQSVFSHLSINNIELCLKNLSSKMKSGGKFYATYFQLEEDEDLRKKEWRDLEGKNAHFSWANGTPEGANSAYHHKVSTIEGVINNNEWNLENLGDWGHPRQQRMLCFTKK